ncbi:MAG: D-alanyl-D-alanine carboxypeptidase [Proteobacteria bacterium]|nr:D-alanyl-D-alanine carboxypeptidase [Pseudomonadota bacterium]
MLKNLFFAFFLISAVLPLQDSELFAASKKKSIKKKSSKKANVNKIKKTVPETKDDLKSESKEGINAPYALLYEDETNTILFENNADKEMDPASMTKMLTAYVVMDQLKAGLIKQDTLFTVSKNAYRKEGSTSFLELDSKVSVIDLLKGLIVQSGNDAAIALAEGIAGTESAFAEMMNKKAKDLAMEKTNFTNSSGIPDEKHKTTARDLLILAKRLREDFPEFYPLWSDSSFEHNKVNQMNRNPLLDDKDLGCDGIKTGCSSVSGYSLTATCSKNGRRLYAVINGLKDKKDRAVEARNIMNYGFNVFDTYRLFDAQHVVDEIPVWYGTANYATIGFLKPVAFTHKKFDPKDVKVEFRYDESLKAPLAKGEVLGKVTIQIQGEKNIEVPIVNLVEIKESGFIKKAYDSLMHLFGARSYKGDKKNLKPIIHMTEK